MAINKDTLDGIIAGLGAMPKKSEIDTPTNNIDLLATETSEGLMSAEDKVKLNNVETGANNYVLPSAGKDSLGGVKTTSDVNSTEGYIPTPIIDGVPYYKDTLYTLPIATADSLGGVKIGKNISISEDGAISVSDVSADQMTGIVPINKGGTGASNIHQARVNLKTSCFVIVGNTTENDETNSGYYQAFSVPTIASVQYTLRLLISPVTPSYDFEEFTVDIKLNTSASEKLTPVGYMSTVEEQYDVINKLYVAYNASITTGGFYFWYKNTSAKSAIRISVLSCTYSNDITQDGLQTISLNTSGACTSQDTISTSTPNVVLFSDIITTKLATSSMAGYMSKEDKAKLDALDSTLTEQAGQLTSLVNNAYNTIGSPSTTTTTSTDSSDIPYNETKTTVKYEFSKPNGGKSTVSSTDTVIKYKNASSSNAGLLSSTDYDYIHSLPDVLSALEETVTNDITTTLDAHVTDTNNPHSVTKAQIGLGLVENKTSATIRNEITKANVTTALGYTPVTPTEFTIHTDEFDDHVANKSNPHSVTKTQIGLSNVENKSSEDIRGEITSTNVIDALTYTPAKATDLTSHISNKSNPHSVTKAQIGLGNVENKTSEDIRGELTSTNVTTALGYTPVTPTDLSDHTSDTNNPHSVTKAQVGLGNVENKSSATIRGEITKTNVTTALGYVPVTPTEFTTHIDEFDDHVANVSNPHSVTKAQIGLGNVENKTSEDIRGELTATNVTDALTYTPAKATDLTSHISNKSNPHSVTKAQIGLDNVENKTSEDIRGELTATNVTTALGYTPVTPTDLSDHTSDTNNPHSVTKAQIGLGNVENKSSATIRGELTKANVTTALGYTPPSSVTFTQSLTSGTKVGTLNVSGTDVDLYAPTNTDTHWTTKLVVGASDTASANAAASNGNVYLNIFDNSTLRNAHKISGTNGVSVTSDSSGNITITGTTYSSIKNPYALEMQFNGTTQVSYDGSSAKTLNITPASIGASADNHTHEYLPLSGGTLTGQLIVLGLEASKPIVVRGIAGSDGNGNVGDLYLQHSANSKIFLGNAGGYTISADGSQYSGNSASATKLTTSAGSATQPVYFSGGKPVATTYTLEKSVPSDAVFTDTVYSHPEYTEQTSGLYKITVDELGHVSAVSSVVKADITALGIPASDTNTHYTSKNVVGSSTDTANTTTALTNGNVYINSVENGAVTSAHKISGSGMSTVTTDTSGNIIVTATHPTSAGNKHIPSGGANGDTLMYSASGTAVWHNDYVVGTQTSSTNEFTGILSGVSALYDGLSIRYYLPYNGTSSTATLKLTLSASGTTTSAIPIYRNNGNAFTNQCGAGSILYLTYRTATNRWTMSAQYDYDTYDRLRHGGYIKCNTDTAIVPDDIIVAKNGVYYPLKTGTAFDITQPILYSRVNIAVNAINDWTYYSIPAYVTTTQSITLTAYKPLFIKGTLSGNIFTPISATPLTQTIPTSDDGYQYILLGSAYDSTHFHMMPEHPIFEYKNEKFRLVGTRDDATTSTSGYMSASDKVKLNDIDPYATNIPFIVGTQTAATGTWTGTTTKISSLVDGQTIRYWLPYNGSGNATLNLTLADGTTTGAIACYWKGTSRLATHYAAGTVITLTYRKSVPIGGSGSYTGWWADADFDYNCDTYDRTRYAQAIKCDTTAITAGNIIVGTGGVFKHLKAGTAFDVTYPILYAASDINASATGTNNYIIMPFAVTTTQSITLTAYKPVFIKGSLSGTTFTPISTAPLTQTVPTSADGYEYILLGVAYNTTDMYLLAEHPIFAFKGGAFGQISSKGITDLSVSGQTVTYTRGDGTTGTITTQDTKVTNTLATTTKAYITGTTSATTNTGTLVFDTGVYLDTTAGRLYAKEFSEGGSLLSGKYRAHLACTVGQSSPVSDPWFKVGDIIFANYVYKNYDHMTTFRVFKPYADNARAVGILTTHIRTTSEGTFSSGELIWEYAGEGINIDNFKMACQPNSTTFTVELWVKIPYEWQYYHFDYIAAGNRTVIFNGVGWNLKSHAADGVASITEGYTIINSTLLKLKNPIANNQYLPTTGGLMTGNIGFHGSRCDREIIKFIDNTHDSSGQGIAIGGGGVTIIGGGESAYAARDMYTDGSAEDMLICNDWTIDFYSNCQNGMDSAKHYEMASGVITSESFNATSSYKINNKVAIQYNSTEECVNFVFS